MAGGIAFGVLSLLLPIALIALVIAAIGAARRADEDDEPAEPGIGTVRRVFLYGLQFIALIFAAVGVSLLVRGALDAVAGDRVIAASETELAIALAFTVVGVPAWLLFAFLGERTVQQHPVERRSQARRLYLGAARGVALIVVMVNAVSAGRFLVGLDDFEGGAWGWLLTWAGVWLLHARVVRAQPPPSRATAQLDRFYLYFGAVVGLYVLAGGLVRALQAPLSGLYDELWRDTLVSRSWDESLREALVIAAVGLAVWGWHWLRSLARPDAGSTLWHTYLFLFAIAVSMAATITSAATVLYLALQWWLGVPESATAAAHFSNIPPALSVLVVAAISWGYHRSVLVEHATAEGAPWSEPERIYRYLGATAGLLALAGGVVTLIAVAVDAALTPASGGLVQDSGWWRNPLVLGVTLLVVGVPLWLRYWFQAEREADRRGVAERATRARRVFLFGVFGLAALVTLVNLTIILFQLFEGVLGGTLDADRLRDSRWSLALVLVAGAVATYYWLVLREDQRLVPDDAPPAEVRTREVILVTAAPSPALARAIEAIPGVRLRAWRRLDGGETAALDDGQLATLRERLLAADAERFLLVAEGGRFDLIPYEPS